MLRPGLSVGSRSEPRKDDRHAASNRFARSKDAAGTHEQDRTLARRSPRSHVRSLKVNLAFCRGTVNYDSIETALALLNSPWIIHDPQILQVPHVAQPPALHAAHRNLAALFVVHS